MRVVFSNASDDRGRSPQRLKPQGISRILRRGLKPRPFKAKSRSEFFGHFLKSLVRLAAIVVLLFSTCLASSGEQKYAVKGMVIRVDTAHKTLDVSCQTIPGYMEAMEMPFSVRDAKELDGLTPGATIQFTLVVGSESSYVEGIHVQSYQGLEVDPLTARRLRLMNKLTDSVQAAIKPVVIGERVPDFTLIDQNGHRVRLGKFAGKVVALNFIYTRCALPDFCFRTANNFGQVQKRFPARMGRDLVLLTVSFDPARDTPEVMLKYSKIWKASPSWYFLTGPVANVQRLCAQFGVDVFQDEGLMNHSLHTAVIDRAGKLVANIEGNQFTAEQLGDLVGAALGPK